MGDACGGLVWAIIKLQLSLSWTAAIGIITSPIAAIHVFGNLIISIVVVHDSGIMYYFRH